MLFRSGLSGGEVSRLSLACRVEAADRGHAGCLVFDEADVGIGGRTADTVGRPSRRAMAPYLRR